MKAIHLIVQERYEQIYKHNRSIDSDVWSNDQGQLMYAVTVLTNEFADIRQAFPPTAWNLNIWKKMINKPYKDRLIIAAALLAAERDRIDRLLEIKLNTHL